MYLLQEKQLSNINMRTLYNNICSSFSMTNLRIILYDESFNIITTLQSISMVISFYRTFYKQIPLTPAGILYNMRLPALKA